MYDPYTIRLVEIHDAIFRLGHEITPISVNRSILWQYDVDHVFSELITILIQTKPFDYGVM